MAEVSIYSLGGPILKRIMIVTFSMLLTALLLGLSFGPVPTSAAVIWSDDFNDGNYDGWTISGINVTSYPPPSWVITELDGNFTIENGMLKAHGPEWNWAKHSSNIAYGTWSFDIHAVDSSLAHFYVTFMTMDGEAILGPSDGYAFMVATHSDRPGGFTGFRLYRYNDLMWSPAFGEYRTSRGPAGGYHVDITRNLAGEFNVWINGTLRMSGQDTLHTTSESFLFNTPAGSSIDNVVVSDTVDFEPPTTTETTTTETTMESTTPPPSTDMTMILLIGGGAILAIVVIVIILKKR